MVMTGGKLGVAYYQVETAHVYVMPDVAEAEDLGILQSSKIINTTPMNYLTTYMIHFFVYLGIEIIDAIL